MDLLKMSIQGGIIIILTVIIRSVWLNKLPKTAFIIMWEAAVIRLLIPFELPLLHRTESVTVNTPHTVIPSPAATFTHSVGTVVHDAAAVTESAKKAFSVDMPRLVWFIGMCAFAAYFIVTYCMCRREFGASIPVKSDFISSWIGEHKLRRTVTVRQTDAISSPLTYGIINPVILLPKNIDISNKQQLRIVLLHELMHIRRFDGVLKFFSTAAACVHWFNPLVWVMRELLARDIELRCDESVLRELGIDSRAEYALTLIELEEKRSGLQPIGSSLAKGAVKERIVAIMKFKTKTVLSVMLAIVLTGAVAITAVAISAANSADEPEADIMQDISDSQADDSSNEKTESIAAVKPGEAGTTQYVSLSETSDGTMIPSYADTENLITVRPNDTVIFTNDGSDFPIVLDIAVLKVNRLFLDSVDYSEDDNIEFGYILDEEMFSSQTFDGSDPTAAPNDNFGKAADFGYWYRLPKVGNYKFYITNHGDKELVLNSITLTQLHDRSNAAAHIEDEATEDTSPKSYQEVWGEDPKPTALTIDRLYAGGSLHPIRDFYKDGGIYTGNDITYPAFLENDGTYHEAYYATHFKKGEKAAVIIDLGEIGIEDPEELSEYISSLKVYSVVEFRDIKTSYALTFRKIIWSPLGAPNGKTYLVSMFEAPNDGNYTFNSVNLGESNVPLSGHWVQLQNSDDPDNSITCRLTDDESAMTDLHENVATCIELYSSIDSFVSADDC